MGTHGCHMGVTLYNSFDIHSCLVSWGHSLDNFPFGVTWGSHFEQLVIYTFFLSFHLCPILLHFSFKVTLGYISMNISVEVTWPFQYFDFDFFTEGLNLNGFFKHFNTWSHDLLAMCLPAQVPNLPNEHLPQFVYITLWIPNIYIIYV